MYAYNLLGLERFIVRATAPLPAGKVTLRYVFLYDGPKPGAGGTEIIYVNGTKVASAKIEQDAAEHLLPRRRRRRRHGRGHPSLHRLSRVG